jgi:hypothetical protein
MHYVTFIVDVAECEQHLLYDLCRDMDGKRASRHGASELAYAGTTRLTKKGEMLSIRAVGVEVARHLNTMPIPRMLAVASEELLLDTVLAMNSGGDFGRVSQS